MKFDRISFLRALSFIGAATATPSCSTSRDKGVSPSLPGISPGGQALQISKVPLAAEQRLVLKASPFDTRIPKPIGEAVETSPGRFEYSGVVQFKLTHRVVRGTVKRFTWKDGQYQLAGAHEKGTKYQFAIIPDLSNSLMSVEV